MWARAKDLPLIVLLFGMTAPAMLVPALHALLLGNEAIFRAFFYSALMVALGFLLIAAATEGRRIRRQGRSHLISISSVFTILPAVLALPVAEAVPDTSFFNVYLDMTSAITTTGLPVYEPQRLAPSVHLWRAEVAWLGGFFMWVVAVAIFAPLNLGGFEVGGAAQVGQGAAVGISQIDRVADPSERLARFAARLAPVYVGLTAVLWLCLVIAGDGPLTAICHAMSVMATSGISPVAGGAAGAPSGLAGEVFLLLFMVFALSRVTFSPDERMDGFTTVARDPELRLGLALVAMLPVLLFFRHWVAAIEADETVTIVEGAAAFWGALFTTASFLSTTGFESAAWGMARSWSGLETPGLILMGLAVFGGGVATTAGGVKLLRVYALYKHGLREMEKLVQPSSVGGAGQAARRFRRQGAFVAWIFFMLFAMSIAVIKSVLVAAMVLGRLETLGLIALLNPDFWRS